MRNLLGYLRRNMARLAQGGKDFAKAAAAGDFPAT
jgi:hypothetical protein